MKDYADFLIAGAFFINSAIALLSYLETRKTHKNIKLLEVNTNSIKDALVKVTGEAEHAKGVIQGMKQSDLK